MSPMYNFFKSKDLKILHDLSKIPNLLITRPDKGRGVVLLSRSDYTSKMHSILSDSTKFEKCPIQDPYKLSLQTEDKLLRFLRSMKNKKTLHPSTYENIHPVGSGPGVLYGLPKVHKPNTPLRPILAAYNTAAYNSAKFLVPLLEPLTTNTFTLKNSYDFKNSICSLPNHNNSAFMCSYDVTSLFTNIPLTETSDIICNTLFPTGNEYFHNFCKSDFHTFLKLVVSDTLFVFDRTYYTQKDGVAMGSPLGPTFANIFLSHHEQKWLEECPSSFKPTAYFRYVDDTFTIFKDRSHSTSFLNYLNNKHPNISFTIETETDHKLSFLDTTISSAGGSFTCEVFRKETFTGLATSFYSNCCQQFKLNSMRTLIHRAFHLSSSYSLFHSEINFLSNFFSNNGYPLQLFEKFTARFLNRVYSNIPKTTSVPKLPFYFSAPFYNDHSSKHIKSLVSTLSPFYPQINFLPSLSNPYTIGSFFRFKDRLPTELMSGVVYKFTCGGCNASYVGSANTLPFPLPLSLKPGTTLNNCGQPISSSNFFILDSTTSNLPILESLFIN